MVQATHPTAEPDVLFASDTLLAVDKPAGIIIHGDGTGAETLTDQVRPLVAARHGDPAQVQALQRLDRDTSGIVLFSLDKATQPAYDRIFREHELTKRYLAVVEGTPVWEEMTIDEPIGRDRHDARRMRVSPTGKPACTHVRLQATMRFRGRRYSLIDVEIETGRKHQIRVHLAHLGHPIVGDALYGRSDARGLMLHARELAFTDPVTHEAVDIVAPVPERFRALFPLIGAPSA